MASLLSDLQACLGSDRVLTDAMALCLAAGIHQRRKAPTRWP